MQKNTIYTLAALGYIIFWLIAEAYVIIPGYLYLGGLVDTLVKTGVVIIAICASVFIVIQLLNRLKEKKEIKFPV